MIYKIIGAGIAFAGLLMAAKFGRPLVGLIMIFAGIFLAMKKGIKPR